jgi:hypothetical protein
MRYLTVAEVLEINAVVMGGEAALRDRALLESAVARPRASALEVDAYPKPYQQGGGPLTLVGPEPPLCGRQ